MADEVVMERSQFAAPDATIAVGTFAVSGIVEALSNGTPLHGKVIVIVERRNLVNTPR